MEAELLNISPILGEYEEHNIADSGNTVWLKFFDEKCVEWCGVFILGWCSGSSVQSVPNKVEFLVLNASNCITEEPDAAVPLVRICMRGGLR